jgi:hypothetical protein
MLLYINIGWSRYFYLIVLEGLSWKFTLFRLVIFNFVLNIAFLSWIWICSWSCLTFTKWFSQNCPLARFLYIKCLSSYKLRYLVKEFLMLLSIVFLKVCIDFFDLINYFICHLFPIRIINQHLNFLFFFFFCLSQFFFFFPFFVFFILWNRFSIYFQFAIFTLVRVK